jgi:chromosome segregation ATPase
MELERVENNYKSTVEELENQVTQLRSEASNIQMDKDQLEREISHDSQSTNVFLNEIEGLQERIRNSEEQIQKNEMRNKDKMNDLKNVVVDLENQNALSKEKISKLEKEIKDFKESKDKRIKDIEEFKNKMTLKEKELATIKLKVENFDKEKDYLKKDLDESKRNETKLKLEYKDIVDKMKGIKENQNNELRKCEERISNLEKKIENEKNQVIILTEKLKIANARADEVKNIDVENKSQSQNVESTVVTSSLSDVLESAEQENALVAKNIQLQNEVESLSKKISDLTNKNNLKNNAEIEVLKKENTSIKQNIKDLQEMYENQIKDLQKKTVTVNNEYQSFRRTTTKISTVGGGGVPGGESQNPEAMTRHLTIIHDLEAKLKALRAEVKYLGEKIEILTKDVETQKGLREKDVKFLKEELKNADNMTVNAKVALAQTVFEKDDQIMQLKSLNKKMKTKLIQLQGGVTTGTTIKK